MVNGLRSRLVFAAAAVAGLAVAACGAPGSPGRPPAPSASPATAVPSAPAARVAVHLTVPAADRYGKLAPPRTLIVPPGWTAQVWARVPAARIEAWTPGGDLLVSQPTLGRIVELRPGTHSASARVLLSGLSGPQGMAFGRFAGRWVLYVGEYHQIDRYPWAAGGVSGRRTVIVAHLPGLHPADYAHPEKDLVIAPNGTLYFGVGSATNDSPGNRRSSPPQAVIMAVQPDGSGLQVVEKGVRNGEGLAVAPDGTVWTAINNRDNLTYPFHRPYGGSADAFGQAIPGYINEHPPDEVVPVQPGRDLGWPYCNPDQDLSTPAGSLADVPFTADAVTNPGGHRLPCPALPPVEVGLPAHSAPVGMSFLEHTSLPAPWSGGAVIAVHGSWDRQPPRPPAVLWLPWDAARRTLAPAVPLAGGFQEPDGRRWGRPVDAVAGPDGALYVSDDTAGAIYRLVPPG